jgi:hypothetical protein
MDKKALVEFLRQLNVVPNGPFTGKVTLAINLNQGGITDIKRNVEDTILK